MGRGHPLSAGAKAAVFGSLVGILLTTVDGKPLGFATFSSALGLFLFCKIQINSGKHTLSSVFYGSSNLAF
jgi:hypothetical protein